MSLRPPRGEDAAAVAALASAHSPERVAPLRLLRAWTAPGVDVERDARVGEGQYALVENVGDERMLLTLHGRPTGELLDWAERRAAETATRLLVGVWESEPTHRELELRGFRKVRHSYRMVADLDDEPEPPVWPAGVSTRTFEPGDERTFYDAHMETFRDHWEPVEIPWEEWSHHALQAPIFEPGSWVLALDGDQAAGFAICHVHPTNAELGWIGVLGVRRPWRRRGLGRALLLRAFRDFRARGLRQVGLGVDAESLTGANRLYESVGMLVAQRLDIYEKLLR
jgi:mycothiol synthase